MLDEVEKVVVKEELVVMIKVEDVVEPVEGVPVSMEIVVVEIFTRSEERGTAPLDALDDEKLELDVVEDDVLNVSKVDGR